MSELSNNIYRLRIPKEVEVIMLFITFPADEKVKTRLDAVCKFQGVTYKKWFETALIESEHDVLTSLISSNSEDQSAWMWDADLCRFVRSNDAE